MPLTTSAADPRLGEEKSHAKGAKEEKGIFLCGLGGLGVRQFEAGRAVLPRLNPLPLGEGLLDRATYCRAGCQPQAFHSSFFFRLSGSRNVTVSPVSRLVNRLSRKIFWYSGLPISKA